MSRGLVRWQKTALLRLGIPQYEGDFHAAVERWARRLYEDLRRGERLEEAIERRLGVSVD